jgi:hypothetical protein
VGDWALLIGLKPRIINSTNNSRNSLRESIVNGPIAGYSPGENTVVQTLYLELRVIWRIPVFRDLGPGGLHGSQFVCAA